MTLRAVDVFTPGSYPEHTYVNRSDLRLEESLRDSLDTKGQIVSVAGPSKSGKTVLVEKVVGKEALITVTGASIRKADDIWDLVLDQIGAPISTSEDDKSERSFTGQATATGSIGFKIVAKGEIGGMVGATNTSGKTRGQQHTRRGLQQVVEEIANTERVVLIDDFHYMDRAVQSEVAKSSKEAVRLGVSIVTASVLHRGDDVLRANPELRGRVRAIDLQYWNEAELRKISTAGFDALNASLGKKSQRRFVKESAGSPQLMQLLCLESCFVSNLRTKHSAIMPRLLNFSDVQAISNT